MNFQSEFREKSGGQKIEFPTFFFKELIKESIMINIESLWESAQKSVQFLSNPAPSKHRIVLQFYTESILKEVLSICKEGSKVQASPEEIAQTIRKTFKNIL